jgi:signal transduction histidine kinase
MKGGMMVKERKIKVLLIEDDEDDYILVRDLLSEVPHVDYDIQWASSYEQGLKAIDIPFHDVCLLDYRLGERNGIDLLYEVMGMGYRVPIIFLTGQGNYEVDMEAMKAGAADFLAKGEISGPILDRSIRYSIEHRRVLENLRESEGRCRLLSSELLSAQEAERRNIAREIHDSLGQTLAVIKFEVEGVLEQVRRGTSENAVGALQKLMSTVQNASEEARRIQLDLRPPMLDDFGVEVTINWFCREFQKVYSAIQIDKRIEIEEENKIPQTLGISLYRIVQEAFNNIARHSKGNRVLLSLESNNNGVAMTIQDNGRGFDPEEVRKRYRRGMGLSSMKERAELSGGTLSIQSAEGKGTTLSFTWPLQGKAGI